MSFTQILTSASPCLRVPTGSVSTRKAHTPARTARQATGFRTTGSCAKVSLGVLRPKGKSCGTPQEFDRTLKRILDCYDDELRVSNRLLLVLQQISMSARCPPRVLGKHVQTQRVHSPVSTARMVTESLRTDRGVTVRLLSLCLLHTQGLASSVCECVCGPFISVMSLIQHICQKKFLTSTSLAFAVVSIFLGQWYFYAEVLQVATGKNWQAAMLATQCPFLTIDSVLSVPALEQSRTIERPDNRQNVAIKGDFASWIRLDVNSIRCDGFDPKSPKSSELNNPKILLPDITS